MEAEHLSLTNPYPRRKVNKILLSNYLWSLIVCIPYTTREADETNSRGNLKICIVQNLLDTRAVWKVRELTLWLRVKTLWRCGDGLFSKYPSLQAMHFLQRSTHFSKACCRPFAANFRIMEQAVLTSHVRFSVSKALPPLENCSSSHCIVSIGLMNEL
jgi:hypothetical protein